MSKKPEEPGGTPPGFINIEVSSQELAQIRGLGDFDLTMLLSEIHDHGWPVAQRTLPLMAKAHGGSDAERAALFEQLGSVVHAAGLPVLEPRPPKRRN